MESSLYSHYSETTLFSFEKDIKIFFSNDIEARSAIIVFDSHGQSVQKGSSKRLEKDQKINTRGDVY